MKKERREVQNLILMFSSAVFVAFLVVVGVVYYFGSSGTYLLRNILVSPETLEKVSFKDYDPQTGKQGRFVFNKIEFVRAGMQGREWGRFAVSKQSYAEFYRRVSSQRSIPMLTDEIVAQFEQIAPSTLTIFARMGENGETIFQQVQFLDQGDLFRVQLRHPIERRSPRDEWIYFRYPGIYQEVVKLFAPTL